MRQPDAGVAGGRLHDRAAGRSAPDASAASIIRSAIRSFTEPPGLKYSTLASTVACKPSSRFEFHQRGVADEIDHRLDVTHESSLSALRMQFSPSGRAKRVFSWYWGEEL